MHSFKDLADACRQDAPLAPLTWFKLGGAAEYLIEPRSEEELATVIGRCRDRDMPCRVLGLGANVLVRDEGVRGVVVRLTHPVFNRVDIDGVQVTAGAGVDLTLLIKTCVRRGLSGLEQVAGIPASVGGAIRMNCGGRYGEVGDSVDHVRVIEPDGTTADRGREELDFGYRSCSLNGDFVVSASFGLSKDDPEVVRARFREIWAYKQETQPTLGAQSAGCIFKNPEGHSAGALIDRAGLKGLRRGGASVSEQHANFIVAEPGCRSADVIRLIDAVRERVSDAHGIELVSEVQIW